MKRINIKMVGMVFALLSTIPIFGQEIVETLSPDCDVTLRSDRPNEAFPHEKALELYTIRTAWQHPCMLHSQADIDFVKGHLGVSPWKEAYEHLKQSQFAQSSYKEGTSALLDGYLKRMDAQNWSATYPDYNNYTSLMRDAAAAYQLALRYQLSGDTRYADAAVEILNAWKNNCKGFLKLSGYVDDIPDPNEFLMEIQAHQMANAAELLRHYEGWSRTDFKAFQTWMKDTFYSVAIQFLKNHQGGQGSMYCWLNWDLANLTAVLSVGILCDDENMVRFAIDYYKNENGIFAEVGNVKNAIPFIHQDPDSEEQLGQCEESGRDQGHATLCVSLLGVFCQMAYHVGEDLFAYDDYRALAMAEYVGKYNLLKDESFAQFSNTDNGMSADNFVYESDSFPYTAYTNPSWSNPTISDSQRGTKRPVWELFYGYAKAHNLSAIYCKKWVEQMRTYNKYGSDGGAGDYGPNSGGFDQLGYGTLMFAK